MKGPFECPVDHSLVNCICFPFIGNINIIVGVIILVFLQWKFPFLLEPKKEIWLSLSQALSCNAEHLVLPIQK
jgi:hypothetical protein